MEGKLGIHIIETKPGVFTLVGSIPKKLMAVRPAQKADYLAGSAIKDSGYSVTMAYFVPSFDCLESAERWVTENGFQVAGAA